MAVVSFASMDTLRLVVLSFALWLTYRIIDWQIRLHRLRKSLPAVGVILQPWSLLRMCFPKQWQTYHADWQFQNRKQLKFNSQGPDFVALVPMFGNIVIYCYDADGICEIATNPTRFPKDLKLYTVLDVYGRNVVTTEGQEWRLHRKVTSRPFSEKNNQLVHEETVRQTTQMMQSWDSKAVDGEIQIDNISADTMKLALHVITGAGFGFPFTWDKSSDEIWPNHNLSFRDAVDKTLHHLLPLLFLPRPVLKLPIDYLRVTAESYHEFGGYMKDLLEREKKSGNETDTPNLLAALARHAKVTAETGEKGLSDDEIIGNTFIFLIAGHETSARTLLYAFTMLAMNPSVQETLNQEILSTIGTRPPQYSDFNNLTYPLCVQLETLRLFPPVVTIPKNCPQDQLLVGKYKIPAGCTVVLDVVNAHRNPRFWGPNVDEFRPGRFDGRGRMGGSEVLKEAEKEESAPGASYEKLRMPAKGAFVPFSEGSRMCLGRKFTQVEVVACLTMICQNYTIELPKDWTHEMAWEILDKSFSILTMAPPRDIPLVFKRRT